MVRSVMNLIIVLGSNIKWIMTINLYLMTLEKSVEIKYKYGSLKQPIDKKILWRVTMLIFLGDWVVEGSYSEQKEDY